MVKNTIINRRSFILAGSAGLLISQPALAKTKFNFTSGLSGSQRTSHYRGKTIVRYRTREKVGTIIINTSERRLYRVLPGGKAVKYGVGVGRAGFEWSGVAKIQRKAEWPAWRPPAEMIARERKKYGRELPQVMEGGPNNPLGARALYLYQGNRDTLYRIHGTNNPTSIGRAQSSGCIRMLNEEVIELFDSTRRGTKVIVL